MSVSKEIIQYELQKTIRNFNELLYVHAPRVPEIRDQLKDITSQISILEYRLREQPEIGTPGQYKGIISIDIPCEPFVHGKPNE